MLNKIMGPLKANDSIKNETNDCGIKMSEIIIHFL